MAAGPHPSSAIPGFLDPKTGAFTTQLGAQTGSDLSNLAMATYNGNFILKFTITLKSGIPADWPIQCQGGVQPLDSSGLYYNDTKVVYATRSGNTATCSMSIYYAWSLADSDAQVTTSYYVSTYGTSTSLASRYAYGTLPRVTLPANNGTLSRNVNVTL